MSAIRRRSYLTLSTSSLSQACNDGGGLIKRRIYLTFSTSSLYQACNAGGGLIKRRNYLTFSTSSLYQACNDGGGLIKRRLVEKVMELRLLRRPPPSLQAWYNLLVEKVK
jgi:hypothetical protein